MAKKRRKGQGKLAGKVLGGSKASLGASSAPKPTGLNPPRPPQGFYDPALDAAERAGRRGLGDLTQDVERDNERASTAWIQGRERQSTTHGWSLADLLSGRNRGMEDLTRSRDRAVEDIGVSRGRLGEDFRTNTSLLGRKFRHMGQAQAQGAQAAGVAGGGALAASRARRQENQGIEQRALDTGFRRAGQDLDTSQRRVGEDFTTGSGRLGQDYATGVGRANASNAWALQDIDQGFQYGVDDRATALGRASREQIFFGQDTAEQRSFQAAAAGYVPPKPPKPKKPKGSLSGKITGKPKTSIGGL